MKPKKPQPPLKPGVMYVLIGTKVLDDGTIAFIGQAPGERVMQTLEEHFQEHPSSNTVQVAEVVGTFERRISVEQIL